MKICIKNATIVNEGKMFKGNVLIDQDLIKEISENPISETADKTIDAEDLFLFPGVIDDQVHFREPGLTHKAEIYTEAKAAVAGGITSYMEMPNTMPQTTTIDLLNQKYDRAAEVSLANYSFYIGATNTNIDEVLKADPKNVCGIKCFMGSSTGNMLVENDGLKTLFKNAHMIVATHNEEEAIIQANIKAYRERYNEDVQISMHPLIRSAEACYVSSSKAVDLAHRYGTRLHILHLSTARELELFENCDLSKKQITNEVCVHHLWFDDQDYIRFGNRIKWNPAIKSEADRDALRYGLTLGKIDVVATDHAPHTIEEKSRSYFQAPSGGPLVQHSLVAMLEMVRQGIFTYEKVIEKMCHAPAKLFEIEKRGFIRKGYKADLVLVDPHSKWTVSKSNILSKCQWSPFEGISFRHQVVTTFVNGKPVYDKGVFDETQKGERLIFNR